MRDLATSETGGTAGRSPRRGAIVLAGGRSTRMGRDKASLPFGEPGETLLARVVATLGSVVDEIVVVARRGQDLPDASRAAGTASYRVTFDATEGKGPLGGLVPGLRALEAPVAFASSCDVPFLSAAFVERVLAALEDGRAGAPVDVAIPEAQGFLHPLGAAYRRTVLPHLEALLAEDRLRPVFLLERVPHAKVPEDALREVDPDLSSLDNLNTPEAYEAALSRWSRQRPPA